MYIICVEKSMLFKLYFDFWKNFSKARRTKRNEYWYETSLTCDGRYGSFSKFTKNNEDYQVWIIMLLLMISFPTKKWWMDSSKYEKGVTLPWQKWFLVKIIIISKKLHTINWLPTSMLLIQRYQVLVVQSLKHSMKSKLKMLSKRYPE